MRHTHTTSRRQWNTAVLAGLIALGSGAVLAQTPVPTAPPVSPTVAAPAMGFGQISEAVQKLGYTEIREIERKSDKLYEIKALDSEGRRTELYVDARTGEVLKSETRGHRRHRDGERGDGERRFLR